MKIIIIKESKYRCGTGKRISSITEEGLLDTLNLVVEEDQDLQVGDIFTYEGQLFGIDSTDTLCLLTTPTGPMAINRIWNEVVKVEKEILEDSPGDEYEVTSLERSEGIPERGTRRVNLDRINRKEFRLWKDKFDSRNNLWKFTFKNNECWIDDPVEVHVSMDGIQVSEGGIISLLEDDILADVVTGALRLIYKNNPRVEKPEKPDPLKSLTVYEN